ncbi:DNA-binding response regulator, partial [Tenacibaculum maritimum]
MSLFFLQVFLRFLNKKKCTFRFADYIIDDLDRKILYELSIGTKMKNLPDVVPLSITAIERRKREIKKMFSISSLDDRDLILTAREKGFI